MGKGGGGDNSQIQSLQAKQIKQTMQLQSEQNATLKQQQAAAAAAKAKVDANNLEDQKDAARRASMGVLSNILASDPTAKKQTLGG